MTFAECRFSDPQIKEEEVMKALSMSILAMPDQMELVLGEGSLFLVSNGLP